MKRSHAWPDGHWKWAIPVTHKHGVRSGRMVFVGGQVDLDRQARVLHPGDLAAQTRQVMAYIGRVLADLDAGMGDLVKLVAYYSGDEAVLVENIAGSLGPPPGPALTAVPVGHLAYPGLLVEIEAVAMTDGARRAVPADGLASPLSHGLRCDDMVFVGAQDARGGDGAPLHPGDLPRQSEVAMERLGAVLGELGASFDQVVKVNNYYLGGGTEADWELGARVRARYFTEPGPAATGIPLTRFGGEGLTTRIEVTAMDGERHHVWPEGHWDWPIHLPYKHGVRCGELIHLGGQVSLSTRGEVIDPGDMARQTRASMDNIRAILEGFGAGLDDVVKVTAFYRGGASAEELHANFRIRSASFTEPGPATTGVPLPFLAYEGMVIEIEVIAILG